MPSRLAVAVWYIKAKCWATVSCVFMSRSPFVAADRSFRLQGALESRQLLGPDLLIVAHPALVNKPDGDDVEAVHHAPSLLPSLHQTGFAKHAEMLHHAVSGEAGNPLRELTPGSGAPTKQVQDRPPRRVRERLPDPIEVRFSAPRRASRLPASGSIPAPFRPSSHPCTPREAVRRSRS